MFDIDALIRTNPRRKVEDFRFAEAIGGVQATIGLPNDRRIEALFDRRPNGERRSKVETVNREV